MQPRELALKILYDVEYHKAYVNISFQNYLEKTKLSPRDAAFVKELVYGVLRYKLSLDHRIKTLSSVRMKKISPYILCILRLGFYQLIYTDKIPVSAAVNESVKLARKYGHASSAGFVNALLRRGAEQKELPFGCDLSVRYSHPEALVSWLIHVFGKEQAEKIMAANNQTPPLFVRVNTIKITPKALIERLTQEGIACKEGPSSDSALILEETAIQSLASYKEGLFTIQDQNAQLAALVLDPKPGELVFDLCAAPGGKTTHMAELMENKGKIIALDLYEKRLLSVQKAAERLGISIIETEVADASAYDSDRQADKILIDAPCSGLGVIRRRPDIKYKEDLTEFKSLCEIQKSILRRGASLLKPGGDLVYSTCTINPEENEKMIEAFLKTHRDFSLMPVFNKGIKEMGAETLKSGMGTFFPETRGGDGFFIAKLKKESA